MFGFRFCPRLRDRPSNARSCSPAPTRPWRSATIPNRGGLLDETPQSTVSDARVVEEFADRNVVIRCRYAERAWLRTQLIRAMEDVQAGSGRDG
jgi:hypothetical protein